MEFFILISGVESREYDGVSYEVTHFIETYINKYPDIAKKILLKYRNIGLSQVHKKDMGAGRPGRLFAGDGGRCPGPFGREGVVRR